MSRSETCCLTQEKLEVQIEKRRIVMEKRQVNEEERRQFLPEMDLEPVAWVALLFLRCWFRLCCVFLFQAQDMVKVRLRASDER